MEISETMSMEKILKKVYDVHKIIVADTNSSLTVQKANNARLLEQNKQLQTEKASLLSENRTLQIAVSSNSTRGGSCCEVIRDSLETVISSYKQLLQEKDSRIKQLEEELRLRKRNSNTRNTFTDSFEHTPDRLRDAGRSVYSLQLHSQSPDSTCLATPKTTSHKHGQVTPQKSLPLSPSQPIKSSANPGTTASPSQHIKSSANHGTTASPSKPIKSSTNPGSTKSAKSASSSSRDSCTSKNKVGSKKEDMVAMGTSDTGAGGEDVDDLMFDEAMEMVDTQKSRLQKKRNKRSRFSEEVSPEVKRQRQTSPGCSKGMNSTDSNSGHTTDSNSKHATTSPFGILVPDTCGLDESFNLKHPPQSDADPKSKSTKNKRQDQGIQEDFSVMVVPETLAMDAYESSDDDQDTAATKTKAKKGVTGKKFEPVLSGINEMSVENSAEQTKETKKNYKCKVNFDESDVNIRAYDSDAGKDGSAKAGSTKTGSSKTGSLKAVSTVGDDDKDTDDVQYSLRTILHSPGSSGDDDLVEDRSAGIRNAINHRTLDLSSSSICLDSDDDDNDDDDDDNDDDADEHTLKHNSIVSERDSKWLGRASQVRRMKEVDEMFETPEKGKENVDNKKNEQKMNKKKPLFKKTLKHVETTEDNALRRSPRKHSKVYTSASRFKRHDSFDSEEQGKDNNDASRKGKDANEVKRQSVESQSLDMYNVVPVKNGVPVTSKIFQLKVAKTGKQRQKDTEIEVGRSNSKSFQSPKPNITNRVDMGNETLTSPSIIDPGSRFKVPDVVNLCSPSVGSVSDPESPLLLQALDKSSSKYSRSRSSQGKSTESIVKNSKGKKSNRSIKNKLDSISDDSDGTKTKSNRNVPRRAAMQTTLTQGFFSPEQQKGKKSSQTDKDKQLEEVIKLSLEEAEKQGTGSNRDQLGRKPNKNDKFSFKKPTDPVKKDQHKKIGKSSHVVEDLDDTVAPDSVLGGDPSVEVATGAVNGSLDPAADLSMWCEEPDSVEEREPVQCQTISTLPSLETDFCLDDLHNDEDSLQRTSTLVTEDSQDIPSTSASYKFGPRKKIGRRDKTEDKENLDPKSTSPFKSTSPSKTSSILDDSFDRAPKKAESKIAHVTVVRKQDERQKLQGHSCKQCLDYYTAAGLGEEEIKQHMQKCSRHRAEYIPPDTPPHFWSVGFIDTQECVDRGYLKVEKAAKPTTTTSPTAGTSTEEPKFRRRKRLNKYFKSKNETSTMEPDSQEDF